MSESGIECEVRPAFEADLDIVDQHIQVFVRNNELQPRSKKELYRLFPHMFLALVEGRLVGTAALEIYSERLSEIQCLAVTEKCRGRRIGSELVASCVHRAQQQNVVEIMAVTSNERFLLNNGFSFGLPGQKDALFISPKYLQIDEDFASSEICFRLATSEDLYEIADLTTEFSKKGLLLQRNLRELRYLFNRGFVAIHDENVVGCCAIEVYSTRFAEIQCLAVRQNFRGQGIGKQLVRKCIRFAREEQVKEVMAITASGDFFEECGFNYFTPDQRRVLFLRFGNA